MQSNILIKPIFTADLPNGSRQAMSLPAVLCALGAGTALEFGALQSHQQHAWFAFLVQLAALALHHSGQGNLKVSESRWLELLRMLVKGDDHAFCLHVNDLASPAFLQPPVPEGHLDAFKNEALTPDKLDVLITSKNHDVKGNVMAYARPEHWAYALVSLQTMQGYSGRCNYGVSRMNGGMGNRPCVAVAPDLSWSTRLARDVQIWLERREALLKSPGYRENGAALIWLAPWDGKESIGLHDCDPFYIEICRRVRLTFEGNRFVARYAPSEVSRIRSDAKGNTGDIWMPVGIEGKVFTAGPSGLTFSVLQELIIGEKYGQMPAAEVRDEDGDAPIFIAKVLVRGQGKTEGLHERVIPIPAGVQNRFGKRGSAERKHAGALAQELLEVYQTVRKGVLLQAVVTLVSVGEPVSLNRREQRPAAWMAEFDRRVDGLFFNNLWQSLGQLMDPQLASLSWQTLLLRLAWNLLEEAFAMTSLPSTRRYRAMAAAEQVYFSRRRRYFPYSGESIGQDK